jgi:hypothetical protein
MIQHFARRPAIRSLVCALALFGLHYGSAPASDEEINAAESAESVVAPRSPYWCICCDATGSASCCSRCRVASPPRQGGMSADGLGTSHCSESR